MYKQFCMTICSDTFVSHCERIARRWRLPTTSLVGDSFTCVIICFIGETLRYFFCENTISRVWAWLVVRMLRTELFDNLKILNNKGSA